MEIIPVIDLRAGSCSRIVELNPILPTFYREDPLEQAMLFKDQGVNTIHIVDMDGVFCGEPCALPIVKKIIDKSGLSVQISGGYRTMKSIEAALDTGVSRVILTTAMVRQPTLVQEATARFGNQIAVGIDSKDDLAVIEGWEYAVDKSVFEMAEDIKKLGINHIVYNDVKRNGRLCGPAIENIVKLQQQYGAGVIPSGGISSLESLLQLKELGVAEVLVGKAIYSGILDLATAIEKLNN